MSTPSVVVEISPGELLDKIVILELKLAFVRDPDRLREVRHEYALLDVVRRRAIPDSSELTRFCDELREVNTQLWDIEDELRAHEARGEFGDGFVRLARLVYRTNDQRADVKRRINEFLGASIVEVKSYVNYS